jgi:hypothetical protein
MRTPMRRSETRPDSRRAEAARSGDVLGEMVGLAVWRIKRRPVLNRCGEGAAFVLLTAGPRKGVPSAIR